MSESQNPAREPGTIIVGVLLILLGISLLLDRLDLIQLGWGKITLVLMTVLGGYISFDGFRRKSRARVFWGSALFFLGLSLSLPAWRLVERDNFYLMPAFMITLGLSFLVLYAYEPRELSLLIPSFLFLGCGIGAILWRWEYLEWRDVRFAVRTYWPLVFVLWGLALILRRRRPA